MVLLNKILAALPPTEIKRLLPGLKTVRLSANEVVLRIGEPVQYVYFPQDAVLSQVATMADGRSVEVSLIGPEGIVCSGAVLRAQAYRFSTQVQIPGSCLRMEAEKFNADFRRCTTLQARTLSYLRYLLVQIGQRAACNRIHRVKQRLARRLLMIHDRVGKDEFRMTHENLSYMLGTPRSEISIAAESLRKSAIIAYARGKVKILSRVRLETVSCECYGVIHREFVAIG